MFEIGRRDVLVVFLEWREKSGDGKIVKGCKLSFA